MQQFRGGGGKLSWPPAVMLYFYSWFFHLITDMLTEACSKVKDPWPNQKRKDSLGKNCYNNFIIIFNLRKEVPV